MHCSRKNTMFKELERAKVILPSEFKGYLMMRDAQIGPRAWDTINGWSKQTYDYKSIVGYLKKLERPVPGSGKHLEGLSAYVAFGETSFDRGEGEPQQPEQAVPGEEEPLICSVCGEDLEAEEENEEDQVINIKEGLFVLPEDFEGEVLEQAHPGKHKT